MQISRMAPLAWAVFFAGAVGCAARGNETHAPEASAQRVTPSANVETALVSRSAEAPEGARTNPFAGATLYGNPEYARAVKSVPTTSPDEARALAVVAATPVAIWIDTLAKARRVGELLDEATRSATGPSVVTFVLYDVPNRDCAAQASRGELAADAGGEARYRAEFVDRIAAQLRARPQVRVALVLEPDSLANLATNMNVPRCAASADVYKRSIAYAVATLSLPNVALYLDAAHAGWLGWDTNRAKIARIYKEVLDEAGGPDRIRGFATNVSNYNVLRGDDGRRLEPSDPCPDELTYVEKLSASLAKVGIVGKGFVIDTSRNGRAGIRAKWSHWCNVKGAGLGPRPQVAPERLVDAYLWIKPPGESDGISEPTASRFDPSCASPDSAKEAPEAGAWFPSYLKELVRNAQPPL